MAAVIKKTIEGGGERKQGELEKVLPSSGSRRNKDLHTISKTGGESWSYILKIEPMTFSDGLKTGCEKKRSQGRLSLFSKTRKS